MKKKYRDITVDGVKYGWMTKTDILTIWKDKKIIISKDVAHCTVTPGMVAEIIKDPELTFQPPKPDLYFETEMAQNEILGIEP